MRVVQCLFIVGILLNHHSYAEAGLITWGAAQDTLSSLDISANGMNVFAFNGGTVNTTVNGTEFVAANPFGFAAGSFLGGGSTGDVNLNRLLDQSTFSFRTGNQKTIDLGSFSAGRMYEVQVFYTDQRNAQNDRVTSISSTDDGGMTLGPVVNLESDPDNLVNSRFGQFSIGTFIADGNNPDLIVTGNGFASAQINAWQVRDITTVPEPSTACMFGVLMLSTCFRRRRRNPSSRFSG